MYPEFDESRTKENKNQETRKKRRNETRKKRRNYSLELTLQRKEESSEWTRKVSTTRPYNSWSPVSVKPEIYSATNPFLESRIFKKLPAHPPG
jgi:hypothetical protein